MFLSLTLDAQFKGGLNVRNFFRDLHRFTHPNVNAFLRTAIARSASEINSCINAKHSVPSKMNLLSESNALSVAAKQTEATACRIT